MNEDGSIDLTSLPLDKKLELMKAGIIPTILSNDELEAIKTKDPQLHQALTQAMDPHGVVNMTNLPQDM